MMMYRLLLLALSYTKKIRSANRQSTRRDALLAEQALGEGGDTGDFDEQATKAPKAARMVKGSSSAMPPGKKPRP